MNSIQKQEVIAPEEPVPRLLPVISAVLASRASCIHSEGKLAVVDEFTKKSRETLDELWRHLSR